MFKNIKLKMDAPIVHKIIAYASFDGSPTGTQREVQKYQSNDNLNFFGWIENEQVLGICGFEEHLDKVEVHLIAVDETARGKGIGTKMIKTLITTYQKPVEAETDDDAVEFYRKCGFHVKAFTHPKKGKRWTCILQTDSGME